MTRTPARRSVLLALAATGSLGALSACGAGSEVSGGATAGGCDVDAPDTATTVNLLSYASTATDPFAKAMSDGCSTGELTVELPPTDLAGQHQRAVQSFSGPTASYDIVETYGSIRPLYADRGWVVQLDDMIEANSERYALDGIDPALLEAVAYEGKQYTLPTFWGVAVLVYRKDLLEQVGREVPTTFAELVETAQAIKDQTDVKAPLAIPFNPSGDIASQFNQALHSLGGSLFADGQAVPTLDTDLAVKAITALASLRPVMSESVMSFSSPEVITQLQTGQAALGMLMSGRVADLTDPDKSKFADQIAFAVPPSVEPGGLPMTYLSVDGFSIAANSSVDPELLFQLACIGTGEAAAEAAANATIPARTEVAESAELPVKDAALATLPDAEPLPQVPYMADVYTALGAPIGAAVAGETTPQEGAAAAQAAAAAAIAAAGY
ncbi:extracellular solute-binding protein [Kineococcus sp. T13]|uniref:extracellular solute-binding protein n=1 Tax=Kineococcus vitellinus TaxID=2696565 RepID=UPI001412D267|nr:extracellular solute-binding protein [Kineococcus vitellinus]